jgi:hypothetical protein
MSKSIKEHPVHGHVPFGLILFLGLLALGFLIYMTIDMYNKSKKDTVDKNNYKKYSNYFLISSILVFLLLIILCLTHYHIRLYISS